MSAPQFAPADDETQDLLSLIANDPRHAEDEQRFLDACQSDARDHGGIVSVNRVRSLLTNRHGLTIEPRRLSALWNAHTGRGKAMVTTGDWETCQGSSSGNDGRPFRLRRWVGCAS